METAVEYGVYYASNFWKNITGIFDGMDSVRWIRMAAIVGGYLLLRPWFVKIGEKIQAAQYEKQMRADEEARRKKGDKVKITPNSMRGLVETILEEDEEEEVVKGGEKQPPVKKGKKRQGKKKVVELPEDEDSKGESKVDIMDHLMDFEEGEDGW